MVWIIKPVAIHNNYMYSVIDCIYFSSNLNDKIDESVPHLSMVNYTRSDLCNLWFCWFSHRQCFDVWLMNLVMKTTNYTKFRCVFECLNSCCVVEFKKKKKTSILYTDTNSLA